jgi:hypothetical protein
MYVSVALHIQYWRWPTTLLDTWPIRVQTNQSIIQSLNLIYRNQANDGAWGAVLFSSLALMLIRGIE